MRLVLNLVSPLSDSYENYEPNGGGADFPRLKATCSSKTATNLHLAMVSTTGWDGLFSVAGRTVELQQCPHFMTSLLCGKAHRGRTRRVAMRIIMSFGFSGVSALPKKSWGSVSAVLATTHI